jgi:hypothetical protein
MTSLKSFYDRNYFTSKQTKHKYFPSYIIAKLQA